MSGACPLFWPGSLGSRGFENLVNTAVAGDFHHMAISPLLLSELFANGQSGDEIRAFAEERGVTLSHLDGVSTWAPLWRPKQQHLQARFDLAPERCLQLATAVGIESILVVGAFERGALSIPDLARSFGAFCDDADRHGLRVELEFVPFWGIPDLATAWEIVRTASRANGGILVDTWHLVKGSSNLPSDLALLASLPCVQNLQLADASAADIGELYEQGRLRRFPGDGELPLAEILRAARSLRWMGPEIFGAAIDDLDTDEAGARCRDAVKRAKLGS